MAVQKFSQITIAGSPPAPTDQLVGVTGGATDNLFTINQLAAAIGVILSRQHFFGTSFWKGFSGPSFWKG